MQPGRFKLLVLTSCITIWSAEAWATNWYVRSESASYGSASGRDWNNAFSGFADIPWASIACGDTIWVAGGDYAQDLRPAKTCASDTRLSILRAREDAPAATSAAGWASTLATTVHQVNGGAISFAGDWDYITISGRTTASGGQNGWWIDLRGRTAATGIELVNGADADYNIIEYIDLQGPGAIDYTGDGRGIDATPFSGATGNTFSHLRIFDWESAIYNVGINGSVFEYLDIFDIHANNWATWHPNGIYISGAQGGTVRYCTFHRGPQGHGTGEGIFFEQAGGASDWQIYGNVFYDLDSSGLKAIHITSTVANLQIFNNTFDNIIVPGVFLNGGSCGNGSQTRNNLSFATSQPDSCGTMSNNITIASAPDPFVARSAHDYRIIETTGGSYPRNAGTDLSLYFTRDSDGTLYGSDGAWDVGAFEYTSQSTPSLAAPTALRIAP